MYIPTDLVPENDITIIPKKIYNIIKELLDIEISFYDNNKQFYNLLKYVKKNILNNISKRTFWQKNVLSRKSCEHVFGENSKRFKQICGARIDIKCEDNKYLCSQHVGIKHIPKQIVSEKNQCHGTTKYKRRCKKNGINNGYCKYHVKDRNFDELQKENKNLITEKNTKNSVKIESSYNIIDKFKNNKKILKKVYKNKKKQTNVELLDFEKRKNNRFNINILIKNKKTPKYRFYKNYINNLKNNINKYIKSIFNIEDKPINIFILFYKTTQNRNESS